MRAFVVAPSFGAASKSQLKPSPEKAILSRCAAAIAACPHLFIAARVPEGERTRVKAHAAGRAGHTGALSLRSASGRFQTMRFNPLALLPQVEVGCRLRHCPPPLVPQSSRRSRQSRSCMIASWTCVLLLESDLSDGGHTSAVRASGALMVSIFSRPGGRPHSTPSRSDAICALLPLPQPVPSTLPAVHERQETNRGAGRLYSLIA